MAKTIINHPSELEQYVGKEYGVSDWLTVEQEAINMFAEATGDHQWIHVDVEKAKQLSPYKAPIAHGFLVLSYLPMLAEMAIEMKGVAMGVNYGLNKVRFTNATKAGARIRARFTLKEFIEIPGGYRYINNAIIEIEGEEKPACIAEMIAQVYPNPS